MNEQTPIRQYLSRRILGLLLALTLAGCAQLAPADYDLIIANVTVIDAQGGERPNQTVAVRGETITTVANAGGFSGIFMILLGF